MELLEVKEDRTARFRPFKRNRPPAEKSPKKNSPSVPDSSPELLGKLPSFPLFEFSAQSALLIFS